MTPFRKRNVIIPIAFALLVGTQTCNSVMQMSNLAGARAIIKTELELIDVLQRQIAAHKKLETAQTGQIAGLNRLVAAQEREAAALRERVTLQERIIQAQEGSLKIYRGQR